MSTIPKPASGHDPKVHPDLYLSQTRERMGSRRTRPEASSTRSSVVAKTKAEEKTKAVVNRVKEEKSSASTTTRTKTGSSEPSLKERVAIAIKHVKEEEGSSIKHVKVVEGSSSTTSSSSASLMPSEISVEKAEDKNREEDAHVLDDLIEKWNKLNGALEVIDHVLPDITGALLNEGVQEKIMDRPQDILSTDAMGLTRILEKRGEIVNELSRSMTLEEVLSALSPFFNKNWLERNKRHPERFANERAYGAYKRAFGKEENIKSDPSSQKEKATPKKTTASKSKGVSSKETKTKSQPKKQTSRKTDRVSSSRHKSTVKKRKQRKEELSSSSSSDNSDSSSSSDS